MWSPPAAGYVPVVSARSGETEDDLLADLAVGTGGRPDKVGSTRSSERLAKYNQLIRISEDPAIASADASSLGLVRGSVRDRTGHPGGGARLRARPGPAADGEPVTLTALAGGVSCDLWR